MERLTNIQQVNSAIMFGDFTSDQLNSILAAVKFRRNQLTQQTKRSITIGSQVRFVSSRSGQTMAGTVEKVAIKYVTVRTGQGLWRVPASMLEVA
jgi:hypothetical protein